ncbi:hypothetical protein K7X08_008242 [Anisodus acutangulus]|uniref:Uncharacterized protein n=1 Tax=Anisodus acutangulus TaxID=402998 RepID=A0A9Q1MU40_9SOLA|nr:hypothetical protein K7X08_008242 [Anisodus acutangulus]
MLIWGGTSPGYTAMSQLSNMVSYSAPPVGRNTASFSDGPAPAVRSNFCNKFNTAEGSRFGDKATLLIARTMISKSKDLSVGSPDASIAGTIIRKNGVHSKHMLAYWCQALYKGARDRLTKEMLHDTI